VSPVPIMRTQHLLEDKGYTVNWVPITQGLPGAASAVAAGKLDIAWGNSISAVVIFSQSPDCRAVRRPVVRQRQRHGRRDEEPDQEREGHRRQEGRRERHEDRRRRSSSRSVSRRPGVDPNANEYFVPARALEWSACSIRVAPKSSPATCPYVADMELKKIGRVLFTGSDAIGRPRRRRIHREHQVHQRSIPRR
jgi:hypothetical protein